VRCSKISAARAAPLVTAWMMRERVSGMVMSTPGGSVDRSRSGLCDTSISRR